MMLVGRSSVQNAAPPLSRRRREKWQLQAARAAEEPSEPARLSVCIVGHRLGRRRSQLPLRPSPLSLNQPRVSVLPVTPKSRLAARFARIVDRACSRVRRRLRQLPARRFVAAVGRRTTLAPDSAIIVASRWELPPERPLIHHKPDPICSQFPNNPISTHSNRMGSSHITPVTHPNSSSTRKVGISRFLR